jgi:hypothetical protein
MRVPAGARPGPLTAQPASRSGSANCESYPTHHAAVVELHSARSLDLQEECVDRILDEHERLAIERRLAALDVRAQPVRHDLTPLDAARGHLSLSSG